MNARITYEIVGAVAGLLIGSFLNVCISRLPKHESIVRPGSRCPQCGTPIRWSDNIPILSWLLLGRRCRECKAAIPVRYPLVELLTAAWFAVQASRMYTVLHFYQTAGDSSSTAPFAILANLAITVAGCFLIGLLFTDWETGLLPDSLTITGIVAGVLFVCMQAVFLAPGQGQVLLPENAPKITSAGAGHDAGNVFMTGPEATVIGRVLAACAAALLMLAIRKVYQLVRHRDGMGLGDVKLLAMIAAFLGFWPGVLSLFLGVLAAAVYGVVQLARGRATSSSRLPFGSFLAAGALVAAQAGDRIIEAYVRLLHQA